MILLIFFLSSTSALEMNYRSYSLGVYLWSRGLEKYSNREVMDFIKFYNISNAAIPYKSYFNREKTRQLVEQLKAQHVKVELVISNPEYILPDKWAKFKEKLVKIFKSGFNAHLDIEPHTLIDYQKNRDMYLRFFIELLKKIHSLAKEFGKSISVDINPIIFSGYVDEIVSNSDNVILMIYETKKTVKINALVKPYQNQKAAYNDKEIYIALRASDFRSLKELKSFLQVLSKSTEVKTFFIQNFRDLIALSKNDAPKVYSRSFTPLLYSIDKLYSKIFSKL
jgi:hypothetical protein